MRGAASWHSHTHFVILSGYYSDLLSSPSFFSLFFTVSLVKPKMMICFLKQSSRARPGSESPFISLIKVRCFLLPLPWESLFPAGWGLRFDGYAWLSECGAAQLIIVAGSATLAGALRPQFKLLCEHWECRMDPALEREGEPQSEPVFQALLQRESAVRCGGLAS